MSPAKVSRNDNNFDYYDLKSRRYGSEMHVDLKFLSENKAQRISFHSDDGIQVEFESHDKAQLEDLKEIDSSDDDEHHLNSVSLPSHNHNEHQFNSP